MNGALFVIAMLQQLNNFTTLFAITKKREWKAEIAAIKNLNLLFNEVKSCPNNHYHTDISELSHLFEKEPELFF
ncbi:hypothetical protein ASG31_12520 [Chryseobacterium sp. Leaf404]|nr:hypothetical protein ASG31_12520 [Chryseobacterium sp. Leaf404]